LSVAGFQKRLTEVSVRVETTSPLGTDGAWLSPDCAQEEVVPFTVARVERLPAASTASTPNAYVVPQARLDRVAVSCVV
jgi:hypothetical protein